MSSPAASSPGFIQLGTATSPGFAQLATASSPKPPSPTQLEKEAFIGRTPDFELVITPKWLVFSGDEGYRRPQIGKVTITNRDKEPVLFRLRARDRLLIVTSKAYGFLKANESCEINVLITPAEQWHRDPSEYAGRRIRVVVENLMLPPDTVDLPDTQTKINSLGYKVFHATATHAPMTRIYTKFCLLLPRIPEDWAVVEANINKANAAGAATAVANPNLAPTPPQAS